ncbi:MAG: LpqB family beta-propeller domain-containing protein [Bryobacteraceae bacterium]
MSSTEFFRRPAVVLILGLCLIGGGVSVLSRLVSGPSTAPKRVALPHEGGAEAAPAFSPDGKRLAFSLRQTGRKAPYSIVVRTLATGAAAQLTDGPASDLGPAWSPDGASIAFLRVDADRARYMVLPASGGEPRQIADFPLPDPAPTPQPTVCWAPDGRSLYAVAWEKGQPSFIANIAIANGSLRPITRPPAATSGDNSPAISPDGSAFAFVRQSGRNGQHDSEEESDGADIFLADLSGNNLRRLTFDKHYIHGIAWSADGRDVIYAATRSGEQKLWRIAASGGSPRNLLVGGRDTAFPAVAAAGRRLAFTETPALDAIWRIDLTDSDPAASARLLIRSDGREYAPSWSPDGKKIANISSRTGNDEVWVGDADGSNRAPITHVKMWRLGRPSWSPDGRTILFAVRGNGAMEVDRVVSDGRTPPVRVPLPSDSRHFSWSHDGQWIYFEAMAQIWKARADGEQQKKLTNNWGDGEPEESADGKYVYFRRERSIWRVPAAGGAEEEVIGPDHDARWTAFQTAAAGLYYLELDREERTVTVRFYDFQSKKSRELVRLPVTDPSSASTFTVSPDGRYILYPAVDRSETTLVLTANFR